MALKKPIVTAQGIQVSHYRVTYFHSDPLVRECSAWVSAYADELTPSDKPTIPLFAQLRLHGPMYDQYVSKAMICGDVARFDDPYHAMYAALKERPECVKCDMGGDFFTQSEDC